MDKILLLFICFNLFGQKVILSNDLTFADNTVKGIRNYSSLMVRNKLFIGVETNDWKSVDGIIAQKTRINYNFSIISGIRFKKKIRGYFLNLNWNETPRLCIKQKRYNIFLGLKSLNLKNVRSTLGIRYNLIE